MSTRKRAGKKPASKAGASRAQQSDEAALKAATIRAWLAQHDQAQSLDDMVAGLDLRRLQQQQRLIAELVAMHEAGELVLDRRGRYQLKPAQSAPETKPSPARAKRAKAKDKATPSSEESDATQSALKPGDVFEGRVSVRGDGYGFVTPPAAQAAAGDVFLSNREMQGVLDGDLLKIRVTGTGDRGRLEGRLLDVVEAGRESLVGRLHIEAGTALLVPSDPHQPDLVVAEGGRGKARQGQVVVAKILRAADRRHAPQVRVVEVLGDYLGQGVEIETAIRDHGLPHNFSSEVIAEAMACGDKIPDSARKGRRDLRDLPLLTIDGADARDFDDAVCAQAVRGGGWRLWVAIADVSAYVTPHSALDDAALERGTSVYFPERVVPMLPEALSNGLCSLNPDVDRLCMVCEMRVGRDGVTQKAQFYTAVIRSHARLIYEQVAALLAKPKSAALTKRHPELVKPLQALDAAFAALHAARQKRGAIDFESTETRAVFDEKGKIDAIRPVERTRAHRLIEECMIAANVEAAKFVESHEMPAPYRVHASPDGQKVEQLREFLNARGLSLPGGPVPEPADYARAVAALADRPDAAIVQQMMLRSLMQARYAEHDDGHFGLALEHYAHFTSPIRRYPDLLLHRSIKHLLARHKASTAPWTDAQMAALAEHCSTTERRADAATRDVMNWLKCEYMSHRVGETFDGVVTGVAAFGVFVELEGVYVDGMVHISRLGQDYFEYDPKQQRIVGSRNGRAFALGTKMRVEVTRVSLDQRKIDLEPVGQFAQAPRAGQKPKRSRQGKARAKR